MARGSRTFKLRLSPAGMDLLIKAHCRLIQATRQLLPWGTTLYVAVMLLDTFAADQIASGLDRVAGAGLCGAEVRFLGAPCTLNDVAIGIAARAAEVRARRTAPPLHLVYILALDVLASADQPSMRSAYIRTVA